MRIPIGNTQDILALPFLIDSSIKSYQDFLNNKQYIKEIFDCFFPIKKKGKIEIHYLDHYLDYSNVSEENSRIKNSNYAARLIVTFLLKIKKQNKWHTLEKSFYMCEIPIITNRGSFIINGHEKVLVSQIHRAQGLFFNQERGEKDFALDSSVSIIPQVGSWITIILDAKSDFYFRFDKKKKLPLNLLLAGIGYDQSSILNNFAQTLSLKKVDHKFYITNKEEILNFKSYPFNIYSKNKIVGALKKRKNKRILQHDSLYILPNDLIGSWHLLDNFEYNMISSQLDELDQITLVLSDYNVASILRLCAYASKSTALKKQDVSIITNYLDDNFFSSKKYNLSIAGRVKMNYRLGTKSKSLSLTKEDVCLSIIKLISIKSGEDTYDDIDDLKNKKIRSPVDMVSYSLKLGLLKSSKITAESVNACRHIEEVKFAQLISSGPLFSSVKELFNRGVAAQFMDQTNILSEIAHTRRLSSILGKERSGLEARDVHSSHYGKICTIETPEGQSCGLINTLACFAKINEYGFLVTPYVRVHNGVISQQIDYLSSEEESNYKIAEFTDFDSTHTLVKPEVYCRYKHDIILSKAKDIDYMEVSSRQMIGLGSALIPFLQHNDGKRSLMGANMQKQAVPLIYPDSPNVGTGIESHIARSSGSCVVAKNSGTVTKSNSCVIKIQLDQQDLEDIYFLVKYQKSNQKTCINQRAIVKVGDKVQAGDIIADSSSSHNGELALGKNLRVAFMPFHGHNFEDAVVISESLIADETFTSIHVEEFICVARDTQLGKEEITADIPGLSESDLALLDEDGIIKIGTYVTPRTILVGKITPKAEEKMSSEQKLLYAIFGAKSLDVKNTSLRVPHGIFGKVLDVQILTSESVSRRSSKYKPDNIQKADLESLLLSTFGKKDSFEEYSQIIPKTTKEEKIIGILHKYLVDNSKSTSNSSLLSPGVLKVVKVTIATTNRIQPGDKLSGRHGNKGVISRILPREDMPYDSNGQAVDIILNPLGITPRMNIGQMFEAHLGLIADEATRIVRNYMDSTPLDYPGLRTFLEKLLELSPLNIPVSQWSKDKLLSSASDIYDNGLKFAIPSFKTVTTEELAMLSKVCNLPEDSKFTMFDGRTGKAFTNKVFVGSMYIMKLNHLVEDKMHARSVGPYGLINQQPLSGKSQQGGQRLGEMESAAIQAYGAAYTLQEMLTVKSDDIIGRNRMYRNIIKNNLVLETSTPESLKVFQKLLEALCVSLEFINTSKTSKNTKTSKKVSK